MRVVRPETPPNEKAEYPALVGSKDSPPLQADAGLYLGQIKEVTAIDWQILDLLLSNHVLTLA